MYRRSSQRQLPMGTYLVGEEGSSVEPAPSSQLGKDFQQINGHHRNEADIARYANQAHCIRISAVENETSISRQSSRLFAPVDELVPACWDHCCLRDGPHPKCDEIEQVKAWSLSSGLSATRLLLPHRAQSYRYLRDGSINELLPWRRSRQARATT